MNGEKLLRAIGEIDDADILHSETFVEKLSVRRKHAVWFVPVAACVCFMLGIALILKLSGVLGSDHPIPNAGFDFKQVAFSSFEQFASAVPDAFAIGRLQKEGSYELEYHGIVCLTNKNRSQSNYDSYLVVLHKENTVVAEITIIPDEDVNAYKKTAENHSLTNSISIDGTAVNYARNDDEEYFEAVFHLNGEDYSILFYPRSEQALIEILRIMLSE